MARCRVGKAADERRTEPTIPPPHIRSDRPGLHALICAAADRHPQRRGRAVPSFILTSPRAMGDARMTTPLPTANPEDVGLSASALTRLARALEDRVARGHIPGAVALVTRHGKVAFHQAFGVREPAGDQLCQ